MKDNTPKKILFIQSGIPFYYPMIEEAILNSLQKVNSNTIMVNPERAIETALKIKPDFILVLGGLNEGIISIMPVLKNAGFTTGLWLTDDPYYTDVTQHLVPHYDYIFTQDLNCIKFYRGLGCKNVFHLPLAANQDVFKPSQKEDTYKYDLSFIGTAFENRLTFVDSISEYLAEKH